eukprot:m.107579 g.107579  ORF g.107579 m.107579 type:complete len:503 (+) comp15846_c0_seq1:1512-3020(+)
MQKVDSAPVAPRKSTAWEVYLAMGIVGTAVVVQAVLLGWSAAIAWAQGDDTTASPIEEKKIATINSFFENFISYAILFVPATLLIHYLRKHPETVAGPSPLHSVLRSCVFGTEDPSTLNSDTKHKASSAAAPGKDGAPSSSADVESGRPAGGKGKGGKGGAGAGSGDASGGGEETFYSKCMDLSYCVLGLQGSYLVWGVLQEEMMTQSYGTDLAGNPVFFTNSQYLVFLNRALAMTFATVIIMVTQQPRHTVALYKYSFPSMSNILSSWCQYEALKFVSFPTQVLAKASKIIPVMLMGKVVQGKTYPAYEYVCAIIMSIGVGLFLFSRGSKHQDDDDPTAIPVDSFSSALGAIILTGYMVFDSFTSNYQSLLFKQHRMSSYQMMFGVNLFSSIFCAWTLIQQGQMSECLLFTSMYPKFFWHSILLSITSATGQLFIFRTLSRYGALVFAIIMTTRQAISVFLSAIIFNHAFPPLGWLGVILVFIAMFAKIYYATISGEKPGA